MLWICNLFAGAEHTDSSKVRRIIFWRDPICEFNDNAKLTVNRLSRTVPDVHPSTTFPTTSSLFSVFIRGSSSSYCLTKFHFGAVKRTYNVVSRYCDLREMFTSLPQGRERWKDALIFVLNNKRTKKDILQILLSKLMKYYSCN